MSRQSTRATRQVFGKESSAAKGPTVTSSGQLVWSVREMLTSEPRRVAASVLRQNCALANVNKK
jgi:hypothetical protein